MTSKERFLSTAHFQQVDQTFLIPPWYWQETLERWKKEGLPKGINIDDYFGTDKIMGMPVVMNGEFGAALVPPFEEKVLEETDKYAIIREKDGNIVKIFKEDSKNMGHLSSMPQFLEHPIKTRDDWEKNIKPRMDPEHPDRFAGNYEDFVRLVNNHQDKPLEIWICSFYGWIRSWMGVENVSLAFYDNPNLIHDIVEHITYYGLQMIKKYLGKVKADCAFIWEDMSGKAGPLCSPELFEIFFLNGYRKIVDAIHNHGTDIIIIDSDGNNYPIIPLWLKAGVTGLRPLEVAAGEDAVTLRKKYGKNILLQGNIDKRALAKSKEDIEYELLRKVPWLCLQGGYMPQVDHLVPPDVSLENYKYYSELLLKIVKEPEKYLYEAKHKNFWKE